MNRFTSHHLLLHVAIRTGVFIVLLIAALWYRTPADHDVDFESGKTPPVPAAQSVHTTPESGGVMVSESMFQVELWHTPVVTQAEKVEPIVKPTPLRVQLIAIIEDENSGRDAAVMYDPDRDEIRSVYVGSQIGGHDVREITQDAVELGNGARSQRIKLETLEFKL
jgi:hypothetical protein